MLSWLTYRQDGATCVVVERGDVIQARLKADIAHGIDAHFVAGLILDEDRERHVPADAIGRLMSGREAGELLDRIEVRLTPKKPPAPSVKRPRSTRGRRTA